MSFTPADGIESIELMHTDKFVTAPAICCVEVFGGQCAITIQCTIGPKPTNTNY